MTALAILLGTALVGALALVAWLAHGRVAAADQTADARVAQVATEAELERKDLEIEQLRRAVAGAVRRESILQEAIADAINADSSPDLARNDVLGRVRLLTAAWARTDAEGRVPAEPGDAVPEVGATEQAGPVVRPGDA